MKAEKLLEHIKYLQNEFYESGLEVLRLRDKNEELKAVLEKTLEENAQLETERMSNERTIEALKNATAENSDEEFEN